MKRALIIIGLSLVLVTGLAGAYWYTQIHLPMMRFRDPDWLYYAPPQEQREICHQLLANPFADFLDLHDVFITLIDAGDDASVPLLIRALPRKNGPYYCTWSHCMEALRKLTNEPAEDWKFEDWHRWWDEKGHAKYDP